MKDVIEVYTKIIVAFYGFVAPSFTLIITIGLEGFEKKKRRNEEILRNFNIFLRADARELEESEPDESVARIKDRIKAHEAQKAVADKYLRLVNPKRQVLRVFIPLTLALLSISIYHLGRTGWCYSQFNDNIILALKLISIAASFLCFGYALFVLWQLFCIIIDTKQSIVYEKQSETLKPVSTTSSFFAPEQGGAIHPLGSTDVINHKLTEDVVKVQNASKKAITAKSTSSSKKKSVNLTRGNNGSVQSNGHT